MEQVNLTIRLTEEYRQRVNKARAAEDLRKCRSWIDLLGAADPVAEVEINADGVTLRCRNRKGPVQESCTYDGILSLTEMKYGILLRLSHKRLLFLPITDDAENNRLVMDAMLLLSEGCKYVFRSARLRLQGVRIADKIKYHTRPRQGYYTGTFGIDCALIAFACLCLFMATFFVTEPVRNRKIEMDEALVKVGTFERADPVYNKTNLKYIDLEFFDEEEQTIDGCCVSQALEDRLVRIPAGTRMRLLVHPKSDNVLQLEVDGQILLNFDDAQQSLWSESILFLCLGLFVYVVVAYLAIAKIRKKL